MTWDPAKQWAGYVSPVPFEDYSKRYADFFKMERQDGIIELRLHTDNGPYRHTPAAHNAWQRVWQDVGNDPDNQVLIITGTGDKWMIGDPRGLNPKPAADLAPDHIFQRMMDGWKHIESFLHNIDIPTISAVNGPGVHTEFAVLCDVTLAAPDADFMDPHFWLGSPPGDGQGMALQALMGRSGRPTTSTPQSRFRHRKRSSSGSSAIYSRARSCSRRPGTWRVSS